MAQGTSRALLFLGGLLLALPAWAAGWPEKPVRIIVPTGPGGGADIQARVLAETFRAATKQPFLIDNRPGAGTLIGTEMTVDAPPNGYTALFTTANIAVTASFYSKQMKFSVVKDLMPVSWVTSTPLVLVVHPSIPVKSVKELVALAKQRPGALNLGINIPGSTSNLSAEMLKQFGRIDAVIVPYKSGAYAMTSILSGETDVLFAAGSVARPYVAAGRLRALAVTTAKRSSAFPDLPTMNTFYSGFESDNWYAMFLPGKTPRDLVDRFNALIRESLGTEKMRDYMAKDALDPVGSSPEELGRHLEREIAKYAEVIKQGRIQQP
jgi:tripartite-type tricarboxylate transporter receptor subunit TctC